jgi:hypothetical protein
MKKMALVCLLLTAFAYCYAGDTIIVHKDSRLDVLAAKQAAINKLASHLAPNGQYKGYRVQIITTHSRDEAFKAKATFLQSYPNEKSYVSYQSPYFRVRVGNFMNREDAESFKDELNKLFADGVYIVEDIIEHTP